MQLIKPNTKIDFLKLGLPMVILSVVLVLTSLALLTFRGLNFGLDFTGGTLIEVAYDRPAELDSIRDALEGAGFDDAMVQRFDTARDIVVRLPSQGEQASAETSTEVLRALNAAAEGSVEMRRVEFVGPQVGQELKEKGGLAMLYAVIGILIYVWLRFEWRFSVGAIAATVHDSVLTLGFFSLFQIDFDLTILAALLAVIGYSLNDTIVIFDRVRENFQTMRKATPREVMNTSVNQTLSRTVMTSVTTLLVLLALFFLGGDVVHGFALALIVGVLFGTYSTIYVATTLCLWLGVSRQDLMPVQKEGEEAEEAP
jgi:preprotein translocase subunit SecF